MKMLFLAVLCTSLTLHSASSHADNSDIDGVWLIEERLSPFDEAVASVPLLGFLWRQTTGQAEFLILSEENGNVVIHIPQRRVKFTETTRNGNEIVGRTIGPYTSGQRQLEYADVRLRIESGLLTGEFSHANVQVFWRGRQSAETIRDRTLLREFRSELLTARQRISELELSQRSAINPTLRQSPTDAEALRLAYERLATSERVKSQLEREVQQLRDNLARQQSTARSVSSAGTTARRGATPENPPSVASEGTPRGTDTIAAPIVPPVVSEPLEAKRPRSFITIDGPYVGDAIAIPAAGFVSLLGRVDQLRLPLRRFTAAGQLTPVTPSGEFNTVVAITGNTTISFEAVDRDGEIHKATVPVIIRASTGG